MVSYRSIEQSSIHLLIILHPMRFPMRRKLDSFHYLDCTKIVNQGRLLTGNYSSSCGHLCRHRTHLTSPSASLASTVGSFFSFSTELGELAFFFLSRHMVRLEFCNRERAKSLTKVWKFSQLIVHPRRNPLHVSLVSWMTTQRTTGKQPVIFSSISEVRGVDYIACDKNIFLPLVSPFLLVSRLAL